MGFRRSSIGVLALVVCAVPAAALDIDRTTVKIRYVELPSAAVDGLDYGAARAELAWAETEIGDPELRTTTSICVPEGSKSPLDDAVEVATHYYEVPYRSGAGVLVLRDGDGNVLHTARLESLFPAFPDEPAAVAALWPTGADA